MTGAAKVTKHRPRYARRAKFPIADPYRATGRRYPRRFLNTSDPARAKLIEGARAALDDREKLRGAGLVPVRRETSCLIVQELASNAHPVMGRDGHIRVVCGTLSSDRRRRPIGISDDHLVNAIERNYWSVYYARQDLKAARILVSKQPHKWDEDAREWRGMANVHFFTMSALRELGLTADEVDQWFDREEAERRTTAELKAALEKEREAAAAKEREIRGHDHPEWRPPTRAKAASADRILATETVPPGKFAVIAAVMADPRFKDAPAEVRRAEVNARWEALTEQPG